MLHASMERMKGDGAMTNSEVIITDKEYKCRSRLT